MNRLKTQGYSAYLNRFQSGDKDIWYRVRVGRTSESEAKEISQRLASEAGIKEAQVRKL